MSRIAVVRALGDLHLRVVVTQQAHIQSQGLKLLQKHLEGFGDAGLRNIFALDNGLVGLYTAHHIVGFYRQDLLQSVSGAVGLQAPIPPSLRNAGRRTEPCRPGAAGLPGVRACGTGMDLVVYQMMQLQVVHVSHCDRTVEIFAGPAVAEPHFARPAGWERPSTALCDPCSPPGIP